jgi:hypothetical protein
LELKKRVWRRWRKLNNEGLYCTYREKKEGTVEDGMCSINNENEIRVQNFVREPLGKTTLG